MGRASAPRARTPPPCHVRASVEERTADWLEKAADAADRSVMRQCGRIIDAIAAVEPRLPALQRALLDQVLGDPAKFELVLVTGLAAVRDK